MKRLLLLLGLVGALSSCVSTERLTYLQLDEETAENAPDTATYSLQRKKYQVQPNDILSITVRTYDAETAQMFNLQSQSGNLNAQAGDIIFYLQGYSIDLEGYIDMPVLGKIKVTGKTTTQIKDLVQNKLDQYFKEDAAFVTVQLAGVRYSVVGDIAVPGRYVIYQNQVNIFEALAQAGDITIVGDRKQVMILRQTPQGVKTYELDLTRRDIITNPRYFIQPNDIINVKPLPQKSLGIGTTGFQTFAQLFGVLASSVSLIIALTR